MSFGAMNAFAPESVSFPHDVEAYRLYRVPPNQSPKPNSILRCFVSIRE